MSATTEDATRAPASAASHGPQHQTLSQNAWKTRGSCLGLPPEMFSEGNRLDPALTRAAKACCAGCPVQATCLREAVEAKEPVGIWGGMTTHERKQLIEADGLDNALAAIHLRNGVESRYMRGLSAEEIAEEMEADLDQVQPYVDELDAQYLSAS